MRERGILSGEALYAYVCKYAERFDLLRRTQLKPLVVRATNDELDVTKAWALDLASADKPAEKAACLITCSKLIIATGQASQPLLPSFAGMDTFQKPLLHSVELGKAGQFLVSDASVAHVTVVGGSKSAHDAVYMFATAGKRVTWLTRCTGSGAMPMANPYTQVGPWRVWLEGLLMTRSLSWFGASPWSDGDGFGWIRWALHGTAAGQWLVSGNFANMSSSSLDQSRILTDEKTNLMVPDQTLMWYGTQAKSLNYDTDLYQLVKDDNVEVIREDLERLDGDAVILQNEHRVTTDALICAIGYNYGPIFPLEPSDKQLSWGVPVPTSQDKLFPALDARAVAELLERFPILATSPASLERQPGLTPGSLWSFIAPPAQVCASPALSRSFPPSPATRRP